MEEKKKATEKVEEAPAEQISAEQDFQVSETWAQEIIEDMDDFIESQGIYLRQ